MTPYKTVTLIHAPISERYWYNGMECSLDIDNKSIRCGGCWFSLDNRFVYITPELSKWVKENS